MKDNNKILLILLAFGLGVVAASFVDNNTNTTNSDQTTIESEQDGSCCPGGVCPVPTER